MIFDCLPYTQYAESAAADPKLKRARLFIEFIERKLGAKFVYDASSLTFQRPDLAEALTIAHRLQERGIVKSLRRASTLPDEPALRQWVALCGGAKGNAAGGSSVDDDEAAILATLAEGLERYLWNAQSDYFRKPECATSAEIAKRGTYIAPERFASFSKSQREQDPELQLTPATKYLWIQGESLVNGKKTFLPAQTVGGIHQHSGTSIKEPLIRGKITTGLATWPTRAGAHLAGALEVIERDAFMILWLNQLTLPRISLAPLAPKSSSLKILLDRCARYRLKVHAVQMITDAPTHAMCVVVEDISGHDPKYFLGLRAHRSLTHAIEKATLEALRGRIRYRNWSAQNKWDPQTPLDRIGHTERVYYWGTAENSSGLDFLVRGKEIEATSAVWEDDSPEQHLDKIIAWCRTAGYECVSVSLGTSRVNPTPWHVEMVVIPELQPLHLTERRRHLGGKRLKSIPEKFGYTPRSEPFIDAPQPFA